MGVDPVLPLVDDPPKHPQRRQRRRDERKAHAEVQRHRREQRGADERVRDGEGGADRIGRSDRDAGRPEPREDDHGVRTATEDSEDAGVAGVDGEGGHAAGYDSAVPQSVGDATWGGSAAHRSDDPKNAKERPQSAPQHSDQPQDSQVLQPSEKNSVMLPHSGHSGLSPAASRSWVASSSASGPSVDASSGASVAVDPD
mgnify:CR=1 FL=1